jgi:VWFA-related protein
MTKRAPAVAAAAVVAGVVLAVLAARGSAQEPPPPAVATPPTFGREVEIVRVDVVVTDKAGKPVLGLTKDDFTLLDEGKPQTIDTFESAAPDVPSPSVAAATPPRVVSNEPLPPGADTSRSVIIVFDNLNLTILSAARAKAAIAAFLDQGVREGDRVTLIATGGGAWWSTRLPAGRDDLLAILKGLEARRVRSDMRDAITDYEAMRIYLYQDAQVAGRVQRRFENYGATSRIESQREREQRDIYQRGVIDPYVERRATEEYLKIRTRNRVTFVALERAIKPLAVTKERKTVLLVCDGFVYDVQEEGFKQVSEAARRANAVLYFLDTRGLLAPSIYSAQYNAMPGDASDVAAVLADSSFDAEGAEVLANETGGFAVRNTNDLTEGAGRIAREARSYYLLGYSPAVPRDGRFRRLEVKVRGKGLNVRSRRGYYAPSDGLAVAAKRDDAKDPAVQEALDSAVFQSDVSLRMTSYVLGETRKDQARVLVSADVDVSNVSFQEKEGQLLGTLDLLLVVANREGGEFSRYDQKIDLVRKPGIAPPGAAVYPILREFELKPGVYQAKIVVRDLLSQKIGSLAYDFSVPALDRFRVSTPVLTDTVQQAASGVGAVPVARRSFAPGRSLYCQFDVYGASRDRDGQPRVAASHRLRKADGTVLGGSDPTIILPTSLGGVARLMQIPLNLDPGDYELVLDVRDEVSRDSLELVEPFRVVNAK